MAPRVSRRLFRGVITIGEAKWMGTKDGEAGDGRWGTGDAGDRSYGRASRSIPPGTRDQHSGRREMLLEARRSLRSLPGRIVSWSCRLPEGDART
jgi:hypothetical protein